MSAFFFVNKTNSSHVLTRSQAGERKHILSHVQQRRRRQGAAISNREQWKMYTSCMTFLDDSPVAPKEISPTAALHKKSKAQSDSEPLVLTHLPQAYPANNAFDPFRCTVAGSDASTHAMLHYTFASFAKDAFLAEAFAPPSVASRRTSMRHSHIIQQRLERCVEDKMLMYATLAYGSSALAWTTGKLAVERSPEYFIGHALQAVRTRLSQSDHLSDTWLILSIYALAITELWNGIPEMWMKCPARHVKATNAVDHCLDTSRTHLHALILLVERAGGWQNIDPYVMESSILAAKYLARSDLTTPLIPLTWDPGPMPPMKQHQLHSQMNNGLFDLGRNLIRSSIDPELQQLIRDVIEYTQIAHSAWIACAELTLDTESWLFLRLQALSYRLLALEKLKGTDNCIRITALVYLFNGIEYDGGQLSALTTLRYLRSALVDAAFWHTSFDKELLLWCLSTGAMTSQPSPEREWFIETLTQYASDMLPVNAAEQAWIDRLTPYLFLTAKQGRQLRWLLRRLQREDEDRRLLLSFHNKLHCL
ncbi:MAG: hypothetical protein Q9160_005572 [Pyrenula sp. 1 TL-2023]